jgi:GDP-4-dehydro-6-deoxy-D-mannose reductase
VLHVGNLASRRDFSDVRDVVRAYALLMEKGKPGEIYNVCSGRAVSLQQVLKILSSFCRHTVTVHVEPGRTRKAEEQVLFGSNRKLQKTTSWRSLYELKRTLFDLYQYWATILQSEVHTASAGRSIP